MCGQTAVKGYRRVVKKRRLSKFFSYTGLGVAAQAIDQNINKTP